MICQIAIGSLISYRRLSIELKKIRAKFDAYILTLFCNCIIQILFVKKHSIPHPIYYFLPSMFYRV